MKIGVTTWSFEALTLKDSLALCHALGFEYVDIAGFYKRGRCSLDPYEVAREPERYAEILKKELEPYKMKVSDYFPQFGASLDQSSLNDPDPEVRKRNREIIKNSIKFCELVGIPGISLSPGIPHPQVTYDQNLEVAANEFVYLAELAEGTSVTIRVEPHMHAVTETPERVLYILEKAPGVKVTLDYAHFLLQYIPFERIHPLLPYTDHLHVRQARMGKLQTRTVEGEIDYADIAKRLKDLGYNGTFAIEYVHMDWYDCNQVDCIHETVKTKAVLESIFSQLGIPQ